MKIAIHDIVGSFSDGWNKACRELGIEVVHVNIYDVDAITRIRQCDAFMWDWRVNLDKNWLFARQLIIALEAAGVVVFPNVSTCWHYDDKVGEKYLFETLDIPAVPAWIFYNKEQALAWAKDAKFPKVFKLRGGAGSVNVRLAKDYKEARKFIKKMFGRGYSQATGFADFSTKFRKHKKKGDLWRTLVHTLPHVVARIFSRKDFPNERGYVYFQDFIPNNTYDIRVVVTGSKAIALRRNCRPGDFRASGSGEIIYDRELIPKECIRLAFDAARRMKAQSGAYDFVCDRDGKYYIVEVSYGYSPRAYDLCEGYWTDDLCWHNGSVSFEKWQVEDVVNIVNAK